MKDFSSQDDSKSGYDTGQKKFLSAFVLHPKLGRTKHDPYSTNNADRSDDEKLEEAVGLALAINLDIVQARILGVSSSQSSSLFGKGNIESVLHEIGEYAPDVVIINDSLTPIQQRNLEKAWKVKVIDRTGLILEIFADRARTSEGKLQVELALLSYQRSRLVRSWTHLERQRGGHGFTGGPGEKQIELDRRLIDQRISSIKKKLEKVRKNREQQRKARQRIPYPVVALVGYTNAGKSSLFNTLTNDCVLAEDALFATLDPTMRSLELPNGRKVILSDTVGFISDLPTMLVAAFRATLEEVQHADVILHVQDSAKDSCAAEYHDVVEILEQLNIDYDNDSRIIEVLNKADLLEEEKRHILINNVAIKSSSRPMVMTSAVTGEGAETLLGHIANVLDHGRILAAYELPASDGKALSWLYETGEVLSTDVNDGSLNVAVKLDQSDIERFAAQFKHVASSQERS